MTKTAAAVVTLALLAGGGCATPMPASGNVEGVAAARLGETARIGRVAIIPLRVIEDSRCSTHVQCIWAGRVRIEARIEAPGTRRETILILNEPKAVGAGWVTLSAVCPSPIRPDRIPRPEYQFTFGYYADPAPRPVEVACAPST